MTRIPTTPIRTGRTLAVPTFERLSVRLLAAPLFAAASVLPFPAEAAEGERVVAELQGEGISGRVTMEETASGAVLVRVEASGLSQGPHGFHVHEVGACEAEGGFESAGGHLARGLDHGVGAAEGEHPGDLPNLQASADGTVVAEFFTRGFTLDHEGEERLLDADGSAVVIHASADDYTSQPSGNSGDRIACGVLQAER